MKAGHVRHGCYPCLALGLLGCSAGHRLHAQAPDASLSGTGGALATGGSQMTGGASGTGGAAASSSLPPDAADLPAPDGPGSLADGACAVAPIDAATAALAFAEASRRLTPGLIATSVFSAEEKDVPGLWEAMAAQLWFGTVATESGGWVRTCSFLYRRCELTWTNDDCTMFGPIRSGVAADGGFYYSWAPGSGVSYSVLGKLAPTGDGLVATMSPGYLNSSLGPPNLVVAPGVGQVLVYRATTVWNQFNAWTSPELMGTLKDYGDRLAIIDRDGQELGSTLP
jgi:hypothetical protein